MGRIKKVASERHTATASPFISEFVKDATSAPLHELPAKLDGFPQQWPYPRGDMYHWIPLLDRFDHVLELFNKEYGLTKGPQQEPFQCRLLKKGDAQEDMPYPSTGAQQEELDRLRFPEDGDQELVASILSFTRALLESCGNRSLYASSSHLNDLLNTTSLSLLRLCLRLGLRLAQRYQVARYKNNHPHAQAVLLKSHYDLNFDRLQKIAQPFPRPPQAAPGTGTTPGKGKEKSGQGPTFNPGDLVAIAKEPKGTVAKTDLAGIHITYYDQPSPASRPGTSHQPTEAAPVTPTPARRPSALGPSRDRPSMGERSDTGEGGPTPAKSKETEGASSSAPKTFHVPSTKVANTPSWELVKEGLQDLPADSSYDLLNRVRIAKAFAEAKEKAQLLVEVRLLAVSNLAYACNESKFQERIGQADHEEPKRFHLAQQLCDLLQPPTSVQVTLSLQTETAVLLTIEALSRLRHKAHEVSDCLQTAQNHGVLYYELRKVIATLNVEEHQDKNVELEETKWREATFDVVHTLLQSNTQARPAERMVSAGIMSILVEALSLRTSRAERFYDKVLAFFDSFIHGVQSAFQTLANIKGFDIIADLTSFQVTKSLEAVKEGKGLPAELKSKVVDYEIPFYQQTTLRQLFKFIAHMFEHNAGTHDRLLRNLIDTPQILGALRNVIENAPIFGSNVWSGAVNIMSTFIHNEPTSFQVVGEAGLVKSLLQTVVPWELKDDDETSESIDDIPVSLEYKDGELQYPTPMGILPVGETMCDIPTAFGAICLNENGMKQFQQSKALLKFMDIFVSPPHIRALEDEGQTAAAIGQAFDELSRHHPQLKEQIMKTVVIMVRRVGEVCRYLSQHKGVGAKLWERTTSGIAVAGGRQALAPGLDSTSTEPVKPEDIEEEDKDRVSGVPFISACFKFLDGFFNNQGMCSYFCEQGGAVYLLDLATSTSNPHDLVAFPVFSKIAHVLKAMCEAKPHLVLPSLINRTQTAIANLKPLVGVQNPQGVFATYTDLSKPQISSLPSEAPGTTVVKSLAVLHMLTHILGRALAPPSHASARHGHVPNPLFATLNFTDVYIELVDSLCQLHATCIWENLALQKSFSDERKKQTDPKPFMMRRVDANGDVDYAAEIRSGNQTNGTAENGSGDKSASEDRDDKFAVKNAKALRYLLSQAPMGIEAFFHSLGQALTPRRPSDRNVKEHGAIVAEHMAQALVWELEFKKFGTTDELTDCKYVTQVATACSRILLRNSHNMEGPWGTKEALLLLLNKFYLASGFEKLNGSLQHFADKLVGDSVDEAVTSSVRELLGTILGFYSQVVKAKCAAEPGQAQVFNNSNREEASYFVPGQFVVEIRNAVLPAVDRLWHSAALERLGDHQAKTVIEVLRSVLKADGEDKAVKRGDKASRRVRGAKVEFKLKNADGVRTLKSSGYDVPLAREALYRCGGNEAHALEYCSLRKLSVNAPSFPVPEGEPPADQLEASSDLPSSDPAPSDGPSLQRGDSVEMTDAATEQQRSADDEDEEPEDGDDMSEEGRTSTGRLPNEMIVSDLLAMAGGERMTRIEGLLSGNGGPSSSNLPAATTNEPSKDTHQPFTTIEDLDEKRTAVREDLIDRCLEVLSAQSGVTFELADLIQAAVAKSGEGANPRAEIGSTLVSSLMSLQGSEDESGAKISAYAHLVALILQDRDFFDSTLDELREYFDAIATWVYIDSEKTSEDAPWIEAVLAIIERVLAEDEEPAEISWKPPPAEDPLKEMPEPEVPEPWVSHDSRTHLFDRLVELLPKVGKNASLALSVSRVLVALTRRRDFALRLSEKPSMSRLFLMIRQLAGSVDEKLQGCFMIILRHMVEDEAMLRQIMRTEIKAAFENHRSSRPMDSTTYTRNLYHLVLRDPGLFAKVTQELVEVARYDGSPHRAQSLTLKKDKPAEAAPPKPEQPEQPAEGDSGAQKSIEETSAEGAAKPTEAKPPTVEVTDGVVQFLLRELSNYRDVEDKQSNSTKENASAPTNGTSSGDVEMSDAAPSTTTPSTESSSKTEKQAFKPEEHTIYIYRCFIMQCLAELLSSYNRTKVEFINFSRKPETQPATPSKPRAGTLNYLLNALIPVGTLEHRDDIALRKKLSTSHWATSVIVSLCSKTTEFQTPREITLDDSSDDESDLTYVRKFVLEHALRAFKEATTSTEQLDVRYSRLLALGELFNRVLSSKTEITSTTRAGTSAVSSQQIGKLMYERNFIPALTSAIAELDLNFPNAKRAVKYILGPLKQLTDLGVWLSQNTDISSSSTGGTTDEEEISSATSLSDEDEEREQTPDLYRNSTLGMFESSANRGEESSSESDGDEDDQDMYDGYDEEMDYEGDPMQDGDHGDVISDEDEDIEDNGEMGPIEGLHGDVDMDVDIVVEGDEDDMDDEDGSSDEDGDDEDDEDGDDFDDQMDEITGDDENASMPDHDHGDQWEDDDLEQAMMADGGSPHGGPLDQLARVIGGPPDEEYDEADDVVRIDVNDEDGPDYFEDEMPPDEDDDEEPDYENELVYEPEVEGLWTRMRELLNELQRFDNPADEDDEDDGRWGGWDAPPPPGRMFDGGHHHHHGINFDSMFRMAANGEGFRVPGMRTHRTTTGGRAGGEDDGTNPLLQREGSGGDRDRPAGFPPGAARRMGLPRNGDAIIQDLVNSIGGAGNHAINVNIEPRFGGGIPQMPPMFAIGDRHGHALVDIDPSRPWREQIGLPRFADLTPSHRAHGARTPSSDEAQAVEFRPVLTVSRWQEEARMLFSGKHLEKATRIISTLLRLLVPAAMEAKNKAEAERKAAEERMREDAKKREEAEKAAREAREEKERLERQEKEAREAEEARAREEAERAAAEAGQSEESTTMEGVESSQAASDPPTSVPSEAQPAEPATERITTTIGGREVDITSLGIDPGYLEALPEEMRQEVIMGQFAEQRSQAAQSGGQPNEISPEFLEALPPEIQRELLRSEAMDRRRREQEEARRQAAQAGNAPAAQAEDMDNSNFIATLDPTLRQSVLLEADEATLATLPEHLQAEARALGGRRLPRADQLGGAGRYGDASGRLDRAYLNRAEHYQREAERQRRPVVQMLDKAGIATLLRLMFVSLHHKAKNNLHSILSDVCKNTHNRAEVISILLSILQDGTLDVNAVERSFAALSLRAKQTSAPKTPQPLKRTVTGTMAAPGAELSPLNIVQQCLATLNALSTDNSRVPSFFLTEHETVISQKTKSAKKGKGHESRAAKFPLNALLTLLDRKLITENPGVMETLASLLSRVARPLQHLYKRQESKDEQAKEAKEYVEAPTGDVQMGEAAGPSTTDNAGDSATAESSTEAQEPKPEDAEASDKKPEEKKKHRDLVAPDVPEENIRLVVNIFTARECPSKTMSETLDVIRYLSYIPGAREVFARELVRQAQQLSEAVLGDLQELAKQIDAAESGTSMQGVALANFSSATSQQQKLLRTVTALDHLFDPEQMPSLPASSPAASQPKLREEILATLYESPTFDKLWDNLSQCLTAIRKKGNMINVAAILLPLIESLMVVCRNTSLKEPAVETSSPLTVSTPPPAAHLESLFFKFTEEHRKILNELIRTNPKLMNGKFAVLAKNSKVLEFDNKRAFFTRKVHTRPTQGNQRLSHPALQLNVRRDQVFLDSFKSLYYKSGDEVKYGKLNIRFHNEEGIDAGGVSREWFAAMARQMFNPDYALFNPVASDRTTFHPNPVSEVNPDHLTFFKFIGRIIAKALYEGRVLDCHFSRAVYRRILGKSVSLKDMESLDLEYYKSLVWILENDITDITFETFSVDVDRFGAVETVDLIPNGQNIPVTEENKQDYVRLVVEHRLVKSVEDQLENFLAGFHEIIPAELISIFNEQELELLISGLPEIEIDDWKANTEYHNYQATSPQIQWFWRAVRSFDKEEKAKLLQFVTGTSKVPLNGFKELEGMNGFAKFNIHRDYSSKEKLPSSHTCFNQLDLPEYESYEHLRQQLYTAITAGSEYFGFA
ncbi:E3 ubiquitin-protein ligase tom1 [Saxophila tyrrhenica]|uniref:HECT-type E3 ubiquitin transferase n=1 Tax=Saxophila tyrrhenica TaxID=1690608 RepID=A0AAV9PS11_9PEZI|nr:E3 ubiquitin-protein ligase tom1 [Saxophila tyrrhenica]